MALERLKQPRGAKAVFIDKDGTLVDDVPYNVDPQCVRLMAGAGRALHGMKEAGFKLIVISNQSGIARGSSKSRILCPSTGRFKVCWRRMMLKSTRFTIALTAPPIIADAVSRSQE